MSGCITLVLYRHLNVSKVPILFLSAWALYCNPLDITHYVYRIRYVTVIPAVPPPSVYPVLAGRNSRMRKPNMLEHLRSAGISG